MGTSAEPVPRRIEQEAVSEAGERSSIIKADKKAGKHSSGRTWSAS